MKHHHRDNNFHDRSDLDSFEFTDGAVDQIRHWHLSFQENFSSLHLWDGHHGLDAVAGRQWSDFGHVDVNGTRPFNYEQGFYVNPDSQLGKLVNPFSIDHGVLEITAAPVTDPTVRNLVHVDADHQVGTPPHDPTAYTTGMINTHNSFSQTYGYFEMRAELPHANGFLPAFWLLPADGSHGEIDIMEVLGSDPTKLYTTAHSFGGGPNPDPGKSTIVDDTSKGFHTYGLDWGADKITWYFDGRQVFQTDTPSDLHRPMYMIANLAVGGHWPGDADGKTTAHMQIDYLRAYDASPSSEHNAHLTYGLDDGSHQNGGSAPQVHALDFI